MMLAAMLATACIAVEGDQIRVSDLARALPAFAGAAAAEEVAIAPAPGARRFMGYRELERIAARLGVELPPAASACFERATETLDEARIRTALEPALKNEKGTWELLDFARYPAPRGTLEFIAPPRAPSGAPVTVRGVVRYPPNRTFAVWARIRITRPPREVERGAMVDVEVLSGAATLKFAARAETGGEAGQMVVLRNPATKKCFSGRVAGPGRVTVDANNESSIRPGLRAGAGLAGGGR